MAKKIVKRTYNKDPKFRKEAASIRITSWVLDKMRKDKRTINNIIETSAVNENNWKAPKK